MTMAQSVKYYVSGHTAEGYVNYLSQNLQGIDHVIILQHENGSALTPVFQQVAEKFEKQGEIVEIISGLMHADTLVGVIVRGESTAILASSIVLDPMPTATILDVNKHSTGPVHSFNSTQEDEILETVYSYFQKGLQHHDNLEKIYVKEMDFAKADELAADFIQKLLKDAKKKQRTPVVFERLFGTNTPDGKINHVASLIAPIQNVYYVKGRAGTGKSVFMKKVLQACIDDGFDIEMYRCSFDPSSVDMIIVRELDFCIFDSTPPHEFSPETKQGEIIDLYELTVRPGTDERYQNDIRQWTKKYQAEMKKGMQELKTLKHVYSESNMNLMIEPVLEEIYNQMHHMKM